MPRNKPQIQQRDPLPEGFNTLEEFWVFWDTHSAADYEDVMEDIDAHVDIHSSKVYCAVAKDVLTQAREQARRQGVSIETLINLWLQKKAAAAVQSK
jgi:hypothetical protein